MAALYVLLHHAYMEAAAEVEPRRLPFLLQHGTNWLAYGPIAVDIFIVLSGYCLMRPVAQAGGRLRGGVVPYLLRRARRILPPYYAALALSLLLIALTPAMNRIGGCRWDIALPALHVPTVVSHVLLVHNLNAHWSRAIDPPMWSIATEWQIYWLFPLALLPLWRRFGSGATVGAAFFAGLLPHFVWHQGDFACPWFLGLFALGMAAASVTMGAKNAGSLSSTRRIQYAAGACFLTLGVFLGATWTASDWLWANSYAMDTLIGLATASFLVFCTEHCLDREKSPPLALRLVETPAAVFLGSFSYSLYLVHFPLLSLLHVWLRSAALPASATLLLLLGVGAPMCVLASYGFHLLFERRWMPGSPQQAREAADASVISPAP